MGIDQGRAQIRVAKQFLYRADIHIGLEQMGGKTVPETVGRGPFIEHGQTLGAGWGET